MNWEKIIVNNISEKGLIPKIYMEPLQLQNTKKKKKKNTVDL